MEREKLKSRLGFILLSAGCAIGIGNVWKFPYIAGQGGAKSMCIILRIYQITDFCFQILFPFTIHHTASR